MKKTKNKKAKGVNKSSLLGGAAKSLRKLGKGTARLSTTQKVVGGAALVALGLSYLSKRRAKSNGSAPADSTHAQAAEESMAAMDGNA